MVLYLIEFLQIMHFVYDPTFDYLWKNSVLNGLFSIFKYTQLVILLETHNFTLQVAIFGLFFLLLLALQVHFVYMGLIRDASSKGHSTGLRNIERLLVGILVGLNTILFIPMLQMVLAMTVCIHGSRFAAARAECYDGLGITMTVFGIIAFLFIIKEVFFLCYLMNDQDPFKRNPFSHPKPSFLLGRFASKLVVTVYAHVDSFVSSDD